MKTPKQRGNKTVSVHTNPRKREARGTRPRLETEGSPVVRWNEAWVPETTLSPAAQYAQLRAQLANKLAQFEGRTSTDGLLSSSEVVSAYREGQLAVLELVESSLINGSIAPEIAREWRAIRADIAQLQGLNAPTRNVNVNVEVDPAKMGLFARFLRETRFVPMDVLPRLWSLCAELSSPPTPESIGKLIAAGAQDEVN